MKLFLPKKLLDIPVIGNLSKMLNYYNENSNLELSSYNVKKREDPVRDFIELCTSSIEYPENQDRDSIVNYLVRLFYGVKGSLKVFSFIESYLGISFIGEVKYTIDQVELGIENVIVDNEELFYQLLREFLGALLYFKELKITSSTADLVVSGEINNSIGGGVILYKEIMVDSYEDTSGET